MRRRNDLIWRAAVAAVALVFAVGSAPQPLGGALVLVALALTAERLARGRGRGALDALLVGLGGSVVTIMLVGLVLGASSVGLGVETWSVALSGLALLGLGVAAFSPRPTSTVSRGRRLGEALRILPWAAASIAVIAFAVTMSIDSVAPTESAPVQMSFGEMNGTNIDVVVSSTAITGPLELRSSLNGAEVSYPLFAVDANGTHTTTVALPLSGRFVVTLGYPDQSQPLRSLTLDR